MIKESYYSSLIDQIELSRASNMPCVLLYLESFIEDEDTWEKVGIISATNSTYEGIGMVREFVRDLDNGRFDNKTHEEKEDF